MAVRPTKEQISQYKKAFDLLDKNHDQVISASELGAAMRSVGLSPTEAELQDMIKTVDADKNGTLTFTEFVKLMIRLVNKSKMKEIKGFFGTFDKNNDGRITAEEVREVFLKGGFPAAEVERITANMLSGADFNKDKIIDIEELLLNYLFYPEDILGL